MANKHDDGHLTKKNLIEHYYEMDFSAEARRHLEDCVACRAAYAAVQADLDGIAADYRQQAMAGLDAHFFPREAATIMARLGALAPVRPFLFARWWPYAAVTAAFLVVCAISLTTYVKQRRYDHLWNEAHAVVLQMGPVRLSTGDVSSVFDNDNASPGFPIEPELQEPAEPVSDLN